MKELKVLQIITGLRPGGAERLLLDLCINFKEKSEIEPIVVSVAPNDQLAKEFYDRNIELHQLVKVKTLSVYINAIYKLLSLVKKEKIKVIHAHMYHALLFSVMVKLFRPSLRIIYTPHNVNISGINQKSNTNLKETVRKGIIKLTSFLRYRDILFSTNMENIADSSKTVVIPNGIYTRKYNKKIEKYPSFTFVCVGRLDLVKNQDLLIEIFGSQKNFFENAKLLLVGAGNNEENLKEKVRLLGLENQVEFVGFQSDPSIFYFKSHVFVMPSLWEGMPLTLLEAGASELPIITTRVGAIPDIAREDEVYYTSLDDFGECMRYVYCNYNEAKAKARLFKEKVLSEYDINVTARKHADLYNALL